MHTREEFLGAGGRDDDGLVVVLLDLLVVLLGVVVGGLQVVLVLLLLAAVLGVGVVGRRALQGLDVLPGFAAGDFMPPPADVLAGLEHAAGARVGDEAVGVGQVRQVGDGEVVAGQVLGLLQALLMSSSFSRSFFLCSNSFIISSSFCAPAAWPCPCPWPADVGCDPANDAARLVDDALAGATATSLAPPKLLPLPLSFCLLGSVGGRNARLYTISALGASKLCASVCSHCSMDARSSAPVPIRSGLPCFAYLWEMWRRMPLDSAAATSSIPFHSNSNQAKQYNIGDVVILEGERLAVRLQLEVLGHALGPAASTRTSWNSTSFSKRHISTRATSAEVGDPNTFTLAIAAAVESSVLAVEHTTELNYYKGAMQAVFVRGRRLDCFGVRAYILAKVNALLRGRTYTRRDETRRTCIDSHIDHGVKPEPDELKKKPPPTRNVYTRRARRMHAEGTPPPRPRADRPADDHIGHHSKEPGCSLCIFTTCFHESRPAIFSYHLATCFLAVKSLRPLSEELTMWERSARVNSSPARYSCLDSISSYTPSMFCSFFSFSAMRASSGCTSLRCGANASWNTSSELGASKLWDSACSHCSMDARSSDPVPYSFLLPSSGKLVHRYRQMALESAVY
ncbi:LOW QUALITY PROTEIN: hypothetical protein U9M48_006029 [Paspalum notatum var. saurae]|uniref:Uncharacterized protein n=1 Tax=Paspalum notatum var. saurae TaxID=547442 RepID=A0AAQ3PYT0_PASNO